jgi:two-component system, sensor histidine kinase and response regulator
MTDKATILIIDDKPSNIYVLEKLLEKPDRILLSATTGRNGLMLALENSIDLIFLDVQMPEMNGFEVAQILKSNKRTRDIPIIFQSAEMKERQSIMKGFEEGAVDYLAKPLDPELTKAKVSVLLKIQMQKKELIEKNNSLEKAEAEITKLNGELEKKIAELEMANKEMESFSYSVSHDLRAPIRSLEGYSKILIEDYATTMDAEANRLLQIIRNNARKMDTLINDLLEFSRLGKKEVQKSSINTEQLVRNIVNEISPVVNNHAKVQFHSLPPANADYTLIKQVWVNLISNGLKYSAKKKEPLIEIGSHSQAAETVYYVKDNGAGFDMQYADKLFGVFQRLHKPTEFEGTGVGLAIVQRIVLKHGGRVWGEGKPQEGATFYFSLPT